VIGAAPRANSHFLDADDFIIAERLFGVLGWNIAS
jgi:hypothetical protein